MFTFLLIVVALCAFIWWVAKSGPAPDFANVLTEAEVETKRVQDEAAKAKSWLSRFWAAVRKVFKPAVEP